MLREWLAGFPRRDLQVLGIVACMAAAYFFLNRGSAVLPGTDQDQTPQVAVDYAERGSAFIHGIPDAPDLAMNLPMATVWASLVVHRWDASQWSYKILVLTGMLILLASICVALSPSPWPPAAAAALLALCLSPDFIIYPQLEYACLVLLAAGLLVWRSRAPSPGRTLAFSLAVGAGLLFRSPLAFFPPLLAVGEWAWGRLRPESRLKSFWKHGLILCVVPYLFLLPWVWMNWVMRHQIVVLEGGQASTNIVAGALGLTQTVEGDWTMLVDPAVDASDPGAVLSWAVKEVRRHPLRYVESFVRRVHLGLSQFPVLWFLAFLALWWFRRDAACRVLGLLAAYFVLIHCAMAVDLRYLTPVWPLLACLAGCLAEPPARTGPLLGPGASARTRVASWVAGLGAAILLSGLALLLVGAVYTSAKAVDLAAASARGGDAWSRALAKAPDDPWLLVGHGRRHLASGDPEAAVADLEKALASRPTMDCALLLAWAKSLKNREAFPLWWTLSDWVVDYRVKMAYRLYRGHGLLARGDRKAGREELVRARKIFEATVWVHGSPAGREKILQEMLVARDERFGSAAMDAMAGLRPKQAYAFCRELAAIAPAADRRCLGLIEDAASSDPLFAAEAAKKADSAALPAAERHRLALLRQRLGDYKGAVSILRDLVRLRPEEGLYYSDLGVNEFLSGAPSDAERHLKKAVELCLGRLAPYASLGAIYMRQGRTREALKIYDTALSIKGPVVDPKVRQDIVEARRLIK
ncbi:MAG: tetratricopeptide repeat protein [Elusimicrobiota bacterium]|jgi:tetratricopeptide (TPR) repeat protein